MCVVTGQVSNKNVKAGREGRKEGRKEGRRVRSFVRSFERIPFTASVSTLMTSASQPLQRRPTVTHSLTHTDTPSLLSAALTHHHSSQPTTRVWYTAYPYSMPYPVHYYVCETGSLADFRGFLQGRTQHNEMPERCMLFGTTSMYVALLTSS